MVKKKLMVSFYLIDSVRKISLTIRPFLWEIITNGLLLTKLEKLLILKKRLINRKSIKH